MTREPPSGGPVRALVVSFGKVGALAHSENYDVVARAVKLPY